MYDYIIVGGGLAGSMLAYLLEKNKYNVLVIERQLLDKKRKLCGGIITPKTYSFLTLEFPKKDIDKIVKENFNKCKIIGKKSMIIEDIDIKIVDRKRLDDYILNKYLKIGGKVLDNTIIEDIDFENNIIISNNGKYRYKYLIGADGTLSYVRKKLTGRIQNRNFAMESFQSNNDITDLIIEFIDNYKGYNWLIPMKQEVCLGTGNVKQDINLDSIYNDLVKRYSFKDNKMGAFLPTGNDILLNSNDVYFIGDAAGIISPITGEGIYYALYSARLLFECFENNCSYEKLMKQTCKKIKKELFLMRFIYNDKIRNFVFKIIINNGLLSLKIKNKVKKILLS